MPDTNPPTRPQLDEEVIAFAGRVFGYARDGNAAQLDHLLQQGLPPNMRNDKGDSLLMLASYHGHADAVRVLLDHGADPMLANDRGQTPLAGAAFKGTLDVAKLLLDRGAAVDGQVDGGRTPLMMAAMFNRTHLVELLLAHGADPALTDATGVTALAAAEIMGAPDTPRQLALLGGANESAP